VTASPGASISALFASKSLGVNLSNGTDEIAALGSSLS